MSSNSFKITSMPYHMMRNPQTRGSHFGALDALLESFMHVFSTMEVHPIYKMIWRSSRCTPPVKSFAWLILVDRLNTKAMLRRHLNTQDDALCVMCNDGVEEHIEHVFFSYPFPQHCWSTINFHWDVALPLRERFVKERELQRLTFFTEVVLIASWKLWKLRNDKIFQRRDPTHILWLANFKNRCLVQSIRLFKEDLKSSFLFWLDAFS